MTIKKAQKGARAQTRAAEPARRPRRRAGKTNALVQKQRAEDLAKRTVKASDGRLIVVPKGGFRLKHMLNGLAFAAGEEHYGEPEMLRLFCRRFARLLNFLCRQQGYRTSARDFRYFFGPDDTTLFYHTQLRLLHDLDKTDAKCPTLAHVNWVLRDQWRRTDAAAPQLSRSIRMYFGGYDPNYRGEARKPARGELNAGRTARIAESKARYARMRSMKGEHAESRHKTR
jgi:hypothetical protein